MPSIKKTVEDRLLEKQAQIAARLAGIAAKRRTESRERMARLDRIVGAACRADTTMQDRIKEALNKAVKSPPDREFLKTEGWL
jgi:hypothetical protein